MKEHQATQLFKSIAPKFNHNGKRRGCAARPAAKRARRLFLPVELFLVSTAIPGLYDLALLPYTAFFGIAVYLFLAPCYDKLSGRAFVEFYQAVDPYMTVRVRRMALARLALTLPLLGLCYDQGASLLFWLLLALGAAATSTVIAVRGNRSTSSSFSVQSTARVSESRSRTCVPLHVERPGAPRCGACISTQEFPTH